MEIIDENPVIIAWCGRSISGIISLHRALKDFSDELPEISGDVTYTPLKLPKAEKGKIKEKRTLKHEYEYKPDKARQRC